VRAKGADLKGEEVGDSVLLDATGRPLARDLAATLRGPLADGRWPRRPSPPSAVTVATSSAWARARAGEQRHVPDLQRTAAHLAGAKALRTRRRRASPREARRAGAAAAFPARSLRLRAERSLR
jgi:hypothetical protein